MAAPIARIPSWSSRYRPAEALAAGDHSNLTGRCRAARPSLILDEAQRQQAGVASSIMYVLACGHVLEQ